MMTRFTFALAFGALATGIELALVALLHAPREHLPPHPHDDRAPAPVVAELRPQTTETSSLDPEPLPMVAPQPLSPAAPLEPSALPALTDHHPTSDLVDVLPSLVLGTSLPLGGLRNPVATTQTPPRPRRRPAPVYPAEARRRGVEGFVVVRMHVDASGRVTDVVVIDAEPEGVFEASAREAARRYVFEPARSPQGPTETTVEQRIVFRLR